MCKATCARALAPGINSISSEVEPNGRPVVTVDQHYTAGQAAQTIISEATGGYFAASIGAHYKKYHLSRSKGVEEFRKWQKESVAEAGRQASVLAEMYVSGIATLTPSGDLVVTIGDIHERGLQWEHLLTLLPLLHFLPIPAIVFNVAGREIQLDKKLIRVFELMLPEEQESILKVASRANSKNHQRFTRLLKSIRNCVAFTGFATKDSRHSPAASKLIRDGKNGTESSMSKSPIGSDGIAMPIRRRLKRFCVRFTASLNS